MLIGISIALIIAATFAAAIFSLSQRNFSFSSIARDEKGLSTLEWILLVAAVGGLATAGVIIVRNAVGGAGDQVDDNARTERLAQRDVNTAMRTLNTGTIVSGSDNAAKDATITWGHIQERCSFDRQVDGKYPLRRWRGSFTLKFVTETVTGTTPAPTGGNDKKNWCDAVPTNNLDNNPANFAEPIRTNYNAANACVTWPDSTGVRAPTNNSC